MAETMETVTTESRTSAAPKTTRVAFVLPGLHRVVRGAEVAFESIARDLARVPGYEVTLFGTGAPRDDEPYRFVVGRCRPRERFERWPNLPVFRNEYVYEELSFLPSFLRVYRPQDFDVTVTCSYPFCNWTLLRRKYGGRRPAHVYVTQNGDWAPRATNSEFRFFHCDGLVCTNPEYYEANQARWNSVLIPNGVDPSLFHPGEADRQRLGVPEGAPLIVMVSALIDSKRVLEGVRSAAKVDGAHLRVAGDGPLRGEVERLGAELMPRRFQRVNLPRSDMPNFYRAANVFLHMSQDEPSANAYIEALATGLPIVTHDRYVTQWTLEDQAVMVDTNDLGAVAEAVGRALELRRPEHIAGRRELVERRFAWAKIARQYAEFFQQVTAARAAEGTNGR